MSKASHRRGPEGKRVQRSQKRCALRIELLEQRQLLAVDFEMVDIRTGSGSSSPLNFTTASNTVFFSADDGIRGDELWATDGTTAGTRLVRNISAGAKSSVPNQLTNVGGTIFFDALGEYELWKSDGTSAGTSYVDGTWREGNCLYAVYCDLYSASPNGFTNSGGTLFFNMNPDFDGYSLYKSEAPHTDIEFVKQINSFDGAYGAKPFGFTDVDGTLFFSAPNDTFGTELWKSDGTEAGTFMLADLDSGSGSGFPTRLTNVDGTLYFRGSNGVQGQELWKSDGTASGTILIRNIRPGPGSSNPDRLTNVDGTLYFTANDATHGNELWKSDGTNVGTTLVSDIMPGSADADPASLTEVDGNVFFSALDGTGGRKVFFSDGTALGTNALSVPSGMAAPIDPVDLTNVDGVLYFRAQSIAAGPVELWRVDASSMTIERLQLGMANSPDVGSIHPFAQSLLFAGETSTLGEELYFASESDDDDEIDEAIPLAPGTVTGELETLLGGDTDVDMYAFSAAAGQTLGIDVDHLSGNLDSLLRVFDEAGNQLAVSDNDVGSGAEFSSLEAYVSFFAPSSGTFYAAVTRSGNSKFDAGDGTKDSTTSPALDDAYELILQSEGFVSFLAVDDAATTTENQPITISVLDNDLPDGGVVLAGHMDATNGVVTDNGNGTLTYTPDTGFTVTDSFDYSVALASLELTSPSTTGGDRLGYSIDIDGDYAVVGAYLDDPNGITNAGSAVLFEKTTTGDWQQLALLTGDPQAQTHFGWSVAIDGNTAVVGAHRDKDNGFFAGAAYVFDFDAGGVTSTTKLIGSDTISRDLFGRSVDVSGDTVVVGASTADPVGDFSGAVYVFNRDEGGIGHWGQVKKLTGSTQGAGDRFGHSVSIDNSTLAVGAFRHDGIGADSGSVYIFERNRFGADNWGELKSIEAPDAAAGDRFGFSVSVQGSTVAVGAPHDDEGGLNQLGSVYVLSQNEGGSNNWGQVAKLLANDGAAGDRLGFSVAFDANHIVTGSPQADAGGSSSGRAYLFENVGGTWTQTRVLVNDEVTAADQYGISVGLSSDVAVIGSWLDNRPSNNSGGAYVYDLRVDTATVTVTVGSGAAEQSANQAKKRQTLSIRLPESAYFDAAKTEGIQERQAKSLSAMSMNWEPLKIAAPRSSFSIHDQVFASEIDEAVESDSIERDLECYLDDLVTTGFAQGLLSYRLARQRT
ncbi:hypothetical protein Pla22_26830 [Rubripirellula amarantea]|uniref:Peptidase C-terminal archaeal/bacterial domain-containing protein n=1 Tax=Rubripirellula amarantea TaxID=2527999 RepID=A0A5C5WXN6_9BACT|nr:ELWxxDGT repeat protein [Rubripirellula amarantea]TWT55029.1 hypothetical protein Pla22_26830 [Rubripirellula amarantea]